MSQGSLQGLSQESGVELHSCGQAQLLGLGDLERRIMSGFQQLIPPLPYPAPGLCLVREIQDPGTIEDDSLRNLTSIRCYHDQGM